ncbi:mucin-5AC-like isoform X1 [Amphibalanus amphitrite]|uniref:mucin-5AC-like isoform X1 n=1 Tax=Amphibalanus amphitrite TaxID=1232801 RepID=UPI001C90DC42|nr:mucin-5AC-like isoform X1 [Amphibalanus amphitrite]
MDTAAGDALGATQAALLLLAGDAEDSESSQLPADSAEPPTSPGDSGDLGVTAESTRVTPKGETVPKDEAGSGAEKDAGSDEVAKMDVGMEDAAEAEGEKGKEQGQQGDGGSAEVAETTKQSQDQKTAALASGEVEIVQDEVTETSLKPTVPSLSPRASLGAGIELKIDPTTDGDAHQKSPAPIGTSVGADNTHHPSPVIRRRARLSGQVNDRSKGSGSASLTTEWTGKQSGSDTNHAEKTSAVAAITSTADTITSSESITTFVSTATATTPRCGGTAKKADSSPGSSPRPIPSTPESGSPAPSSDGGCFLAPAGDLGAALLELLLTGRGPPAETLLCRDGSVPVHAAVMAVRCPPLYRELSEAGGRLSLPEVSLRAAAALVRLLYLGEIVFTGGSTPLPQLLLLAERFELLELAYYLKREHGVTMPEPVKEAELVKVTESPSSPAPAETSIDRPPLSPELFDLTASDGGEDMEEGSPVHATASESDREQSPHRDSDSDVVCSPNQSPRRVGANTGLQSPYKRTPGTARSGGTPRRRERTLSDRDKTPVRETGNPSPSRKISGRDSNPVTPSTPRRGQKRPGSPSRRPVSPDDICEVFSSLSKRRRTSSPATPSPVKAQFASPSTKRHQGESRFSRTPVGRRSSSNTPQKVGSGSQEPPPRPVSADSDIEILDEAPMVFTQKVKSPRRSSGLGEDGSPVKEAALESGDQGDQGGVSPSKSQAEPDRERSPVGGVSPQSSPSRFQPRVQTELRDDSFGSSPLISRRQEPAADSQSRPPPPPTVKRRESEANGAGSPVTPRRLLAESDRPDTGGAASSVVMPPCSPEIPAPSSERSPDRTSPVPPSPEVRQRSPVSPTSPPRPASDREGSAEPAPSPPSDPPPADVWDGFEDCGYIELIEPPPPPLGTPLRLAASVPAAAAAAAAETPAGPRSSLDNSELWGDSSLLAGYVTPTEAETTTTSRRADSGIHPFHQENAGDPRVQSTGSDTPVSRLGGAEVPVGRPGDSETSERRSGQAGARSGGTDDAGTPETTMAPPRPPQRTPVNPYRVVLRDSNTPRPNYVLMLTPELKRELARIGVKPISRRKAVALLSHIYEETHPPATGASGGGQAAASQPVTSTAGSRGTSAAASSSAASTSSKTARVKAAAAPSVSSTARPRPASPSDGPESGGDGEFARPREPTPTRDGGRSDSDSDCESSGSEGAAARLEETLSRLGERLEREDEEEEITPSQAASAAALPERLRSYILSRPELYHQVLTYEPVWLESLHRDLRQNGIKLSMAQLMDFLDEQCITFRTENSGRRRKSPKKKKSPKKGSPKKRGPSQKKRSPKKKAS